jgi:hypothetical protein
VRSLFDDPLVGADVDEVAGSDLAELDVHLLPDVRVEYLEPAWSAPAEEVTAGEGVVVGDGELGGCPVFPGDEEAADGVVSLAACGGRSSGSYTGVSWGLVRGVEGV